MELGPWDPVGGSGKKLLFAPLKRSALLLLRFHLLLDQRFWVKNDLTGFQGFSVSLEKSVLVVQRAPGPCPVVQMLRPRSSTALFLDELGFLLLIMVFIMIYGVSWGEKQRQMTQLFRVDGWILRVLPPAFVLMSTLL